MWSKLFVLSVSEKRGGGIIAVIATGKLLWCGNCYYNYKISFCSKICIILGQDGIFMTVKSSSYCVYCRVCFVTSIESQWNWILNLWSNHHSRSHYFPLNGTSEIKLSCKMHLFYCLDVSCMWLVLSTTIPSSVCKSAVFYELLVMDCLSCHTKYMSM